MYSQQAHLALPGEGEGMMSTSSLVWRHNYIPSGLFPLICHRTLSWPREYETDNFFKTGPHYISVAGLKLTM